VGFVDFRGDPTGVGDEGRKLSIGRYLAGRNLAGQVPDGLVKRVTLREGKFREIQGRTSLQA